MNITYTHGRKQWRFFVTTHDPGADLDVSRLTQIPAGQTGHVQNVAARALRDYLALSATERIYDTQNPHPLAHKLVQAVWACMPMRCVGLIPVKAVIAVGGEVVWEDLIMPQRDLFAEWDASKKVKFAGATRVVEWQMLLARDENSRVRYALAWYSQHEDVQMLLARDEDASVRRALAWYSQREAVQMILATDQNVDVRDILAYHSQHEAPQ